MHTVSGHIDRALLEHVMIVLYKFIGSCESLMSLSGSLLEYSENLIGHQAICDPDSRAL